MRTECAVRSHDGPDPFFDAPDAAGYGQDGKGVVALGSWGQELHDGGAVLRRPAAEDGNGHLVAASLALLADTPVGPPHQRMEDEEALHQHLNRVHQSIPSRDVGQFVRQHLRTMIRRNTIEVGGEEDLPAQQSPDEGLGQVVGFPDVWRPAHAQAPGKVGQIPLNRCGSRAAHSGQVPGEPDGPENRNQENRR